MGPNNQLSSKELMRIASLMGAFEIDSPFNESDNEQAAANADVQVLKDHRELCSVCREIKFQLLRSGDWHDHHASVNDLFSAIDVGCPLCRLIARSIRYKREQLIEESKNGSYVVRIKAVRGEATLADVEEEENMECVKGILAAAFDPNVSSDTPREHLSRGYRIRSDGALVFFANRDDPAAAVISRRPPLTELNGDDAFELATSWIEQCERSHKACIHMTDAELPTRLIAVGSADNSQEPHVIPTNGDRGKYIALSYCWGGDHDVKLTQKRVDAGQLEFPLQDLPQTLQDAISITRRLGVPYVWVDALCIIQDSPHDKDWLRESGRMAKTYSNAYLTIAASSAASVHTGIFTLHRKPYTFECRIPYDLPEGTATGSVFVQYQPFRFGASNALEPLQHRAWALQERALSPRVLLYRADQMAWECHTTIINSVGPLHPIPPWTYDSPGRLLPDKNTDGVVWGAITFIGGLQTSVDDYWCNAVVFFSRRQHQMESDKLPALSGLARLIHTYTHDTYLAGLWGSTLESQLLWYRVGLDGFEAPAASRSTVYRAPSWSWASIDGPVVFDDHRDYLKQKPHLYATILEASVDPASQLDPFGQVRTGYITVQGLLKCGHRIEQKDDETILFAFENSNVLAKSWRKAKLRFQFQLKDNARMSKLLEPRNVFDESTEPERDHAPSRKEYRVGQLLADIPTELDSVVSGRRSVWCIRLSAEYGMALVPSDASAEKMEFRRLGLLRVVDWSWFHDAHRATIMII